MDKADTEPYVTLKAVKPIARGEEILIDYKKGYAFMGLKVPMDKSSMRTRSNQFKAKGERDKRAFKRSRQLALGEREADDLRLVRQRTSSSQ